MHLPSDVQRESPAPLCAKDVWDDFTRNLPRGSSVFGASRPPEEADRRLEHAVARRRRLVRVGGGGLAEVVGVGAAEAAAEGVQVERDVLPPGVFQGPEQM